MKCWICKKTIPEKNTKYRFKRWWYYCDCGFMTHDLGIALVIEHVEMSPEQIEEAFSRQTHVSNQPPDIQGASPQA